VPVRPVTLSLPPIRVGVGTATCAVWFVGVVVRTAASRSLRQFQPELVSLSGG